MTDHPLTENQQDAGLSPSERGEIQNHFRAISEIMFRHNMVKMSGGWRIEGKTRDGRLVVHKFGVNGYTKTYPAGYDPGNLTMQQLKDIADV